MWFFSFISSQADAGVLSSRRPFTTNILAFCDSFGATFVGQAAFNMKAWVTDFKEGK